MKSISFRLILIIALVATGAVAAVATALTYMGSRHAHDEALALMSSQAREQAARVSNILNADIAVAETIASAATAAAQSGTANRASFDAFLEQTLADHPGILGTWVGFEPDAFDGNDAPFVNAPGHDGTGRYVPYFARGRSGITHVALVDYEKPGDGDYYQLPKNSGHPVAIEPYSYEVDGEQVLMTSMTFPLTVHGKIAGVGGVDLKLSSVRELVAEAHPLGTGYVAVVSNGGLYVASRHDDWIGKKATEMGLAAEIAGAAEAGKEEIFPAVTDSSGQAVVRATAPIVLNGMSTPWSVVVTVPEVTLFEAQKSLTMIGLATGLLTLLVSTGIAFLVGRTVAKPIQGMTDAMRRLSQGEQTVEIPARARKDEIGSMAAAVQVFKENAIEMERVKKAREEDEKRAQAEKKQMLQDLAASFEAKVGALVQSLSAAATEMESTAGAMTSLAEQGNSKAVAVASASEQTSANVQTVATATEELSASIQEIGKQVATSARIANKAVDDARATDAVVQDLAVGAQKIGEIVQLINDIASQTNLLALNATIEAARAGEAGKGFAVVASEVKSLATQTARATDEISGQIARIQTSTAEAVTAIKGIGTTIQEMSEIAGAIAAAVEEQGAATLEISRNVQQAAQGTEEVSQSIVDVKQAATDTGAASAQVLDAAGELARNSNELGREVDTFLSTIRVA